MANFARRTGTRRATQIVTAVCPAKTTIVVPPVGHSISLVQVIAVNLGADTRAITLYDDSTKLAPQFAIGASGTLFWDEVAGQQYELTTGSGLTACLDIAGSVEVTAFYVLHDNSAGITKSAARGATYVASLVSPRATRKPNIFGGQQEG